MIIIALFALSWAEEIFYTRGTVVSLLNIYLVHVCIWLKQAVCRARQNF